MTIHLVKSWKHLFEPAVKGLKKHDFRDLNERDYKVGDYLILNEYDPATGEYTGRRCSFRITYITSHQTPCAMSSVVLQRGYGVLSIEKEGDVEKV